MDCFFRPKPIFFVLSYFFALFLFSSCGVEESATPLRLDTPALETEQLQENIENRPYVYPELMSLSLEDMQSFRLGEQREIDYSAAIEMLKKVQESSKNQDNLKLARTVKGKRIYRIISLYDSLKDAYEKAEASTMVEKELCRSVTDIFHAAIDTKKIDSRPYFLFAEFISETSEKSSQRTEQDCLQSFSPGAVSSEVELKESSRVPFMAYEAKGALIDELKYLEKEGRFFTGTLADRTYLRIDYNEGNDGVNYYEMSLYPLVNDLVSSSLKQDAITPSLMYISESNQTPGRRTKNPMRFEELSLQDGSLKSDLTPEKIVSIQGGKEQVRRFFHGDEESFNRWFSGITKEQSNNEREKEAQGTLLSLLNRLYVDAQITFVAKGQQKLSPSAPSSVAVRPIWPKENNRPEKLFVYFENDEEVSFEDRRHFLSKPDFNGYVCTNIYIKTSEEDQESVADTISEFPGAQEQSSGEGNTGLVKLKARHASLQEAQEFLQKGIGQGRPRVLRVDQNLYLVLSDGEIQTFQSSIEVIQLMQQSSDYFAVDMLCVADALN